MGQSKPLVTIILTHHLDENRKYLNLALQSIQNQTPQFNFETILVCSSDTVPDARQDVLIIHDKTLNNATKKVHHAVKLADPESKFFLLMSDDVILGKDFLSNIVIDPADAIVNPMSNSDLGTRYYRPIGMPVNADYEEMEPWFTRLFNYVTGLEPLLVRQEWLSFFCTLIPRHVWDKVGLLDERLEVAYNDVQYCNRATQLGIPCLINFGAFAFHFGSKTLDKVAPPALREEARDIYLEWYRSHSNGD